MLHIVAGRRSTQLQSGCVLLGMQLQALYLFGLLARTEYQYARGQWVQCSGMSYLHPLHTHFTGHTGTDKGQRTE